MLAKESSILHKNSFFVSLAVYYIGQYPYKLKITSVKIANKVAVYAVESLLTMRASVLGYVAKRQKTSPTRAFWLAVLSLIKHTRRGSLSRGTWNK